MKYCNKSIIVKWYVYQWYIWLFLSFVIHNVLVKNIYMSWPNPRYNQVLVPASQDCEASYVITTYRKEIKKWAQWLKQVKDLELFITLHLWMLLLFAGRVFVWKTTQERVAVPKARKLGIKSTNCKKKTQFNWGENMEIITGKCVILK